jgi:hypothetical protein
VACLGIYIAASIIEGCPIVAVGGCTNIFVGTTVIGFFHKLPIKTSETIASAAHRWQSQI